MWTYEDTERANRESEAALFAEITKTIPAPDLERLVNQLTPIAQAPVNPRNAVGAIMDDWQRRGLPPTVANFVWGHLMKKHQAYQNIVRNWDITAGLLDEHGCHYNKLGQPVFYTAEEYFKLKGNTDAFRAIPKRRGVLARLLFG
jgi:hypothetical protein